MTAVANVGSANMWARTARRALRYAADGGAIRVGYGHLVVAVTTNCRSGISWCSLATKWSFPTPEGPLTTSAIDLVGLTCTCGILVASRPPPAWLRMPCHVHTQGGTNQAEETAHAPYSRPQNSSRQCHILFNQVARHRALQREPEHAVCNQNLTMGALLMVPSASSIAAKLLDSATLR